MLNFRCRAGNLIPYLTVKALFELIAYNSTPISYDLFRKKYNDFAKKNENRKYIVNESLSFGKGGHKKVTLNTEGLRKFAAEHNRDFQFCSTN